MDAQVIIDALLAKLAKQLAALDTVAPFVGLGGREGNLLRHLYPLRHGQRRADGAVGRPLQRREPALLRGCAEGGH